MNIQTFSNTVRAPMSDAHKVLFKDYPREAWDAHPNFKDATRGWMEAHRNFRGINDICLNATQNGLDKKWSDEKTVQYIGYYGNILVGALHGHHGWEDHRFFPEILAVSDKAEAGLNLLESDHEELDARLDNITLKANRVLKLHDLGEKKDVHEELGALLPEFEGLQGLLARHLEDEEDLIVPIIIHYKLR